MVADIPPTPCHKKASYGPEYSLRKDILQKGSERE